MTNALSRAVSTLVQFILVPISLAYLGADLYGLWTTIGALIGMAAFADLGLGVGLMTKLALCLSAGQTKKARRYISGAYSTLTIVALAAISLLWLASDSIPWASMLNVSPSVGSSAPRIVFLICLTSFIVNLPLSLIVRVQYACQQAAQSNLWQAVGTLSGLPLVLVAVYTRSSPAAVIAAAVTGPVLVSAINNAWFFWRRPEIRPTLHLVGRTDARELFGLSFLFLVLTSVNSAAQNLDAFIVAHTSGLHAVASYSVSAKASALLGLVTSLFVLPLWPANAEALVEGRLDWMQRTVRRVTIISLSAVVIMAVFLGVAGNFAIRLWVGDVAGNDRRLLIGFAIWFMLQAGFTPMTMVQYAAGRIGPQVLGWCLYLGASIPAKWYGATDLGLFSIPYIGSAIYVLVVVPSTIYGYQRALSEARRAALAGHRTPAARHPTTQVASAGPSV